MVQPEAVDRRRKDNSMTKRKRTISDLQNTTQKNKHQVTRTQLKQR
jgi:hypothetical protein